MSNEELKKLAEDDLYIFAKGILGYKDFDPQIHGPICRQLENYEKDRRQVVVLPRSWFKTTLCSIAYPIWRAVRSRGNIRILLIQNTYDNAIAKLASVKAHWEKNELLRMLYPELLPTPQCKWTSDSLCLNRSESYAESTFEGGGTRSQFISRHYDLIIEDDTVAPKLSELGEENVLPVKEDIGQAIGFHKGCTDLQNDFSKSQILVVGTRWFEKDLISYIRDEQNAALRAEGALEYKIYQKSCIENDQPSFPARFDWPVLKQLKAEKGSYMFSCLYLNEPLRSDKMPFRQEWFTYYDQPPLNLVTYTTVDPAGDPTESAGDPDFNVVLTCGVDLDTGRKYVLRYDAEKCNPSRLIQLIFRHQARYQSQVGIETVQYQKSLMHYVKRKMRKKKQFFIVRQLRNAGKGKAKDLRIRGLSPGFENGDIAVKAHHNDLMSQLLAFPYGKNDDIIDALAMQLEMWAQVRNETPKPKPKPAAVGTLEHALAEVKKKQAVNARRVRVLGIVQGGQPVGRIGYRNRRLVRV